MGRRYLLLLVSRISNNQWTGKYPAVSSRQLPGPAAVETTDAADRLNTSKTRHVARDLSMTQSLLRHNECCC